MPPRSVRITLLRHGESVSNQAQRWQGQGDSPLSELGVRQARAAAARLRQRSFDRIVASDLSRASDTAAALGLPFEHERGFREFDVGAWEGFTREEIAARFPDQLQRLAAGEDVALGGGESYAIFAARVDDALVRLTDSMTEGQHALVVCHGGVIGALVAGALGLRDTRELSIGRVYNTAISEIAFDAAGRATLHVFNDALHLAEFGLYPHPVEMRGALALVSERAPAPAFGSFAAHYDYAHLREGMPLPPEGEHPPLQSLLESLTARHVDARVAVSAHAAQVRRWVTEAIWRDQQAAAEIVAPAAGAVSHVHLRQGQLSLVDFGLTADALSQR